MPHDYVTVQRAINTFHRNAQREVFTERALRTVDSMASVIAEKKLPYGSFLDIGCRTGYVLDKLLSIYPSARVEGVDVVPEFVEISNNITDCRVADVHALPFTDDEFDWTFVCQTLEHCYDVPQAINEIKRVSRVGSCISIPLENKGSYTANPSHYAYTTSSFEWIATLERVGWDVCRVHLYGLELIVVLIKSHLIYNDETGERLHET